MNYNKHYELEGQHAFLSPSQYHWLNYSEDKLIDRYYNVMIASQLGTRIHAWASEAIKMGFKQPKNTKTVNMFINDAIGYKMESELVLKYSENCFGTADALSFRQNKLRIHDLKTGVTPAHFEQLQIYAALFCLEYVVDPEKIQIELRIYQNNEVIIQQPDPKIILNIMAKIKKADEIINNINSEELEKYGQ